MKFKCGPNAQEILDKKLRLERELEERTNYLTNWHSYFAWFPVEVAAGDCRWLEQVQRRGVYSNFWDYWSWSYKANETA